MRYPSSSLSKFLAWQPSTWPNPPATFDKNFAKTLEKIIRETILDEINNVIADAQKANQGLVHRGHVVALAMLCSIDTISSYAFKRIRAVCPSCGRSDSIGPKYKKFIADFFPTDYKPFANDIYDLYRNSVVHSWNLFKVGIWPGNEPIAKHRDALSFGLLNFSDALNQAVRNFLSQLTTDRNLQTNSLERYKNLKNSAIP